MTFITNCGIALNLLCPLDCDFRLGLCLLYRMYSILEMKLDFTYDMVDEYPMGNYSLMDIVNLKQLHNLFSTYSVYGKGTKHVIG